MQTCPHIHRPRPLGARACGYVVKSSKIAGNLILFSSFSLQPLRNGAIEYLDVDSTSDTSSAVSLLPHPQLEENQ